MKEILKPIMDRAVLADFWDEIWKRILDNLTGADFWIVLACIAAGLLCWLWIGTAAAEQLVLRRRIGAAMALAAFAGVAIWINHTIFQREPIFSKDHTGILVMRIEGDDAQNSLQGALVDKLNVKLQNESQGQPIEIHEGRKIIDQTGSIELAHAQARAIGKSLNAKLVIWGRKIGDKGFNPRITLVDAPKNWVGKSERTHDTENISELRIPEELVDEPFYLIHFTAGYSYYDQNKYEEALPHFKAALEHHAGSPDEIADLQFFTGYCYSMLGLYKKDMATNAQEAITLYERAAAAYAATNKKMWAKTQIDLGNAYEDLVTGDRDANLQKAISAYQAALTVFTETNSAKAWALIQNNLGTVYALLPTGDRDANLQKAIDAFQEALRVRTEKNSGPDWAETQTNLAAAYYYLPTGDRAANLQKIIDVCNAALRVRTQKDFPAEWAETQITLANAYAALPTGDRAVNLRKAIDIYNAVLPVTKKDRPLDWAMTQNNLGNAYADLPTGNRSSNLQKAIAAYEAALQVRTQKDFPVDWAETNYNLGRAYAAIPDGDVAANLKSAKTCLEAALTVYTENGFPNDHRDAAGVLAYIERQLKDLTP
jgi:tetratricopeptide (TPR) repeat protein